MPTTLVTHEQLLQLCLKLHSIRAQKLAAHFNTICPEYGITTKNIFHEFIANLMEESGCFTRYEENLNYTAERLVQVWPNRFKSVEVAEKYEYNPALLAEFVYGYRKSLGNYLPGDGFNFRGSGPIQMTGRLNFTQFTAWMQFKFNIKKTPEQWAELLRTSDEFGIHSACWIFAIAKKLIDEAERDEMKTIVERINGGLTNFKQRMQNYAKAKKIIV